VLDLFPPSAGTALPKRWVYGGLEYELTPGRYRYFVYPGFGKQSELRLGKLHLKGDFVVPPER